MINNQTLKATLAQKVSEIQPAAHTPQIVGVPQSIQAVVPLTVAITITMPLADAAQYLERLQAILHAPNIISISSGEPQQRAVTLQPAPTATIQSAAQAVGTSPSSSPDRLSDKQRTLILNLSKRKKLTPEQMKELLQDHFHVNDGTLLNKNQASHLIDILMAQ